MYITFVNVGQGDSIILEWKKNNKSIIGIIDSNKENSKSNPTIEYLKKIQIDKVQFILLSHPHYDHFSGLLETFKYIVSLDLQIEQFWLTSFQNRNYLTTACKSIIANQELSQLFKEIRILKDEGIIKEILYVYDQLRDQILTDEISLRLLCPSTDELEKYISNVRVTSQEESPHNNPRANLLSSVVQVFNDSKEWHLLLTSDQEGGIFTKIFKKYKTDLNRNLKLGQVPHHGAKTNLNKFFWGGLRRDDKSPIIISVGKNSYGHPSAETIDFFKKNNFEIFTTNNFWKYMKQPDSTIKNRIITTILDDFSETIDPISGNDRSNGTQRFKIDESGNISYLGN